jgi:hypothetical protein
VKAIATIIIFGLAVGIVGGLVMGDNWFHGGEVVIIGGLIGFFGYVSWRRPDVVIDAMTEQFEDEPQPPAVDVLTMESELRRKDRGEERRNQ